MATKKTARRKVALAKNEAEMQRECNTSRSDVPNCGPVTVALPSFSYERMAAVSDLARAIQNLSKVLIEADVKVNVSHCHIVSGNSGPAINIAKMSD